MSTTMTAVSAVAPVTRRVRAYFAPVNRSTWVPTVFDVAQSGRFSLDAPPTPWVDLGWVTKFVRRSGTKVGALRTGAPAIAVGQVRTDVDATVSLEFEIWGKLQLALASGSQQLNLLKAAVGAAANGSGGVAAAAVPVNTGIGSSSSATGVDVGATAAAGFSVGDLISVDMDYSGQTGFVGTGVSAAYVQSAAAVGSDVNYIRRVSLNVGLVVGIESGVLQLGSALPAGRPSAGMQLSKLVGFCDREGGGFFQEWSALFVMDGEQGDRVIYHYPRLQSMQPSSESTELLASPLERVRLPAAFRSLPVTDVNDGETVLCFRSYLPGPMRAI